MLRLTTFGGIALTQDGKPVVGAAAGQRRLAILILLAESGQRGFDRDTLASMLWPDSESEQARHSLHQALYAMRRAHGDELFMGTRMLHLNPATFSADIWEFEAAIRRRQFEDAAALYRGPFAHGFSFAGESDVEHRLDAMRSRFAREYAAAVEALAADATKHGDHSRRARWWQALADADPLSARTAAELIDALVAAGEKTQALQAALRHESLVKNEFGAAPDPEIVKRILRLRTTGAPGPGSTTNGAPSVLASHRVGPALDSATAAATAAREERRLSKLSRALGTRYRVDSPIEDGSLLTSYGATASQGHRVEVHVVHAHIVAMTSVPRFMDVFKRVAALGRSGVHPVFDFGSDEDVLYYVTPERSHPSLRDRLRQDRELPVRDALAIAHDIAVSLAHAHTSGVRHGDLRPKHIMLGASGTSVGSFGVIDAVAPHAEWRATSTVVTFGSPAYLSPEQLMGDVQADARSDIYAFGCIAYEMLAGEPPFGRPSRGSGLGRKLSQSPPKLRSIRESVPETLEGIVHTCLSRLPADRYASGEALRAELAPLLSK
jgi:serine/threonine-protein kinase